MGDRARALLDRGHRARDRRLERPRARDQRAAAGLGALEDRRAPRPPRPSASPGTGSRRRRRSRRAAQLDPQRAPERLDPRLRRAVGAEPGGGQHGRRGGDEQQVAAALEHVRQRRADRPPDAEQVDVDRLLDRLRRRPAAAARRSRCPRWRPRRRSRRAAARGRRSRRSAPRRRARRRPRSRRRAASAATASSGARVDVDQRRAACPGAASWRASSAPMPGRPPVMSATRPSRFQAIGSER